MYRQILAQQPTNARALLGLGGIAAQQGRFDEATALMRRAIAMDPNDPVLHVSLGNLYLMQDKGGEAFAPLLAALALKPDMAEAHFHIGNASVLCGNSDQAVTAYRQALALRPDHEHAATNLCQVLLGKGELDLVIETAERTLASCPTNPALYCYLARALRESGQLDHVLAVHRAGLARRSDLQLHSDLLFTLNFHPEYNRRRIFEEHKRWAETYADPHAGSWRAHTNDPSPERMLRVGYVAYHLGNNALGRFFFPLLSCHDRRNFEVYVYYETLHADHMARRLRGTAGTWRNTRGIPDDRLAEMMRADGIDILVDLIMHTTGCRMGMFARKPAPVQVIYLAYCGTSGVGAVDYRLTDKYLDPPGPSTDLGEGPLDRDAYYAEKSVHLPGCYWCYPKPDEAPEVGPPPALKNGYVTFGCLNEFTKASPGVLDAWCDVLRRVAGSRLLVHAHFGGHRTRVIDHLERQGIDPARLEFVNRVSVERYFAQYRRIDVALDTFPWAGGTTTCDALFMGVPVVTLAGETAVARGGLSILSNLGKPQWAASSPRQYVSIAEDLARDVSALAKVRGELRGLMRSSPLMDSQRYTLGVERAYREMWRRYCACG
jgi:predicted O-linked N-acetylglucosamine transferase (SPINDLY family)